MFNGPDFPKALDEETFSQWMEDGRQRKLGYQYLLVIWDLYDSEFRPLYVRQREDISGFEKYPLSTGREALVAAYDLYSESRVV